MIVKVDGNNLYLYGIIWDGDGTYVSNEISKEDGKHTTLNVHINTKGGSVFDGNQIYNTLARAKSKINIYVDGLAASMGSILMLPGQKVFMTKSSLVMTHAPSGSVYGNAKDMKSAANLLSKLEKNFLEKYSAKTGKSEEDLRYLLEGDNWLDADDCLQLGLVDEIVPDVFTKDDINMLKDLKVAASMKDSDPFIMGITAKETIIDKNKNQSKMKKQLMTAFAFLATANLQEDSSDTAFVNAITDHLDKLKKANEDLEKENSTLKAQIDGDKSKSIQDAVEAAVKAGKIEAAKKESFVKIGNDSGIESLNAVLESIQPRETITGKITGNGGAAKPEMSWDEYQQKDPRGLEDLKSSDFEAFNAIYKDKFGNDFPA